MSTYLDGEQYCYVEEDGHRYAVYRTEEKRGGIFHPLTALSATREDELIFGTSCGDVCIFNTDKRGVAPDFISNSPDFSKEEYEATYTRKIHPYFYSFADRAPRYALKSAKDSCGASGVLKSTVKHSLAVTFRAKGGSPICEVGTDKSGYSEACRLPSSDVDFSYLDFSSLSFSTADRMTAPISEKEKGWIEKQVAISSSDFRCPIGISEITYRFTVKGRIKKT